MDTQQIIKQVEQKWLAPLIDYNTSLFKKHPLPSHDYTHHQRVWNFSRQILQHLEDQLGAPNLNFTEKLIIAVFFHDLGMVYNPGPKHGKASRILCESYLEEKHLPLLANNPDLLNAIEQHDNKNYQLKEQKELRLLPVLSLADDMDAYGTIGFFRYFEIYRIRKIPFHLIPIKALPNLHQRFQLFENSYPWPDHFIKTHQKRYLLTCNLFNQLREETSGKNEKPLVDFLKKFEHHAIDKKEDYSVLLKKLGQWEEIDFTVELITNFKTELSGKQSI